MTEALESRTAFQLLDQIATRLKERRSFERELSSGEMLNLIQQTLLQIAEKRLDVKIDVSDLSLEIDNKIANLKGRVGIESEIARGNAEAEIQFVNNPHDPHSREILGIIKSFESTITTPYPVDIDRAIKENVQGKMFQKSLTTLVSREISERGAAVRDVSLHLLPNSLKITVT